MKIIYNSDEEEDEKEEKKEKSKEKQKSKNKKSNVKTKKSQVINNNKKACNCGKCDYCKKNKLKVKNINEVQEAVMTEAELEAFLNE